MSKSAPSMPGIRISVTTTSYGEPVNKASASVALVANEVSHRWFSDRSIRRNAGQDVRVVVDEQDPKTGLGHVGLSHSGYRRP